MRTIVQSGNACSDLVAYVHMDAGYITKTAQNLTNDAFVVELLPGMTSAYRGIVASRGGWAGYVGDVAAQVGHGFRRTCLITWSAGSQAAMEAAASADPPDCTVMLDGLYSSEDPAPGPRRVVWSEGLKAVRDLAERAARGEVTARGVPRTLVIFHSAIPTEYASSGECARAVQEWVEERLGEKMHPAVDVRPELLDGHGFTSALALGNLRIVAFPGATAKEHVTEAHLWDEAARLFVPWLFDAASCEPAEPAAEPPSLPPGVRELRVLTPLQRGDDVRAWQLFLRAEGLELDADGVYGPHTAGRTRFFQRAFGLPETGFVDGATLAAAATTPRAFVPVEAPATWPVSLAPARVRGIDVARYQGKVPWKAVRAAGGRFSFNKATEGKGWRDPRFQENAAGCAEADVVGGAYHYFQAQDDPIAQAALFAGEAKGRGALPPANDFESLAGVSAKLAVARSMAFMEETEQRWGRRSMLYTYTAFWAMLLASGALDDAALAFFAERDLWLADYRGEAKVRAPLPWKRWRFWQFDGDGGLVLPSGVDCDYNVFDGTEDAFLAWVASL